MKNNNCLDMILKDIMSKDVYIDKTSSDGISKEWDINDKKLYITIKK